LHIGRFVLERFVFGSSFLNVVLIGCGTFSCWPFVPERFTFGFSFLNDMLVAYRAFYI
jgi:hypothetical protein